MLAKIGGISINYEASGQGRDVVLLHGWGGNLGSFAPVHASLARSFRVYSLDLPGFGLSDEPPVPWGTEEYGELVANFLEELGIKSPIIIGHSFGGRIAIYLGATRDVKKMILVDSAGIRPKRRPSYYAKVYSFKAAKLLARFPLWRKQGDRLVEGLRRRIGSKDYMQASGIMRETLVKVVNEDLRHYLPSIKAPTLIVWGENDTATPLADGRIMERLIPDAGLVILKGAGHFSYLDRLNDFLIIVQHFLKDEIDDGNL